jgi:hypothetical protein
MNKRIIITAALAIALTLTACDEKENPSNEYAQAVAEALAKAGPQLTLQQITHNAEFNNETIPVTIYVADNASDDEYLLHSLSFEYKGKSHKVQISDGVNEIFVYGSLDDIDWGFRISFDDYNFDGYPDINALSSQGASNLMYEIFLYNQKTKEYERNLELSAMMNVTVDNETKTIKTYGKGGHAGMIYSSGEYKWEKGKLALVAKENQDYDNDLDKYIHTVKTLQNGKWVQQIDTVSGEEEEQ